MKKTYRAVELPKFGFENLALTERPVPKLSAGEVLIRLTSASVNYRDVVVVDGTYKPDMKLPIIPLSDACGEVIAIGDSVTRFDVGDRALPVYTRGWINGPATLEQRTARTLGGPFDGVAREMIAVSEDNAVLAPSTLSDREASTLPIAALTAWTTLKQTGVRPGQWILTMGTGGVALFALQFAKLAGASVVALTSSKDKADILSNLGADAVINYHKTLDWANDVREITDGGVDVAVETVGATLPLTLQSMAFNGFVGVIGFLGAKQAPADISKLIGGCIRVQGIATGSRTNLEEAIAAIDAHRLKPVLDEARFSIDRVEAALERQASRAHIGKITIDLS